MKIDVKKRKITSTVLISMTDVVFLLIIFLLLSSNFVNINSIGVTLPQSVSTSKLPTGNIIKVIITRDNDLCLDNKDKKYSQANFVDEMRTRLIQEPDSKVEIWVDEEVQWKNIVPVHDLVTEVGAKRISYPTRYNVD
ncbi:biopolymer transporter ExbD [bacterium]|nr:biopolymer transporter ExbD [bacterium]